MTSNGLLCGSLCPFYSPVPQPGVAMQPSPLASPFGMLPSVPQMSIGRGGSAPSVQYGISSMPVSARLSCIQPALLFWSVILCVFLFLSSARPMTLGIVDLDHSLLFPGLLRRPY